MNMGPGRKPEPLLRTHNMTETTYNGWTNYETWAVALWLGNEQASYRYWRDQAREHRQAATTCPQVAAGIWTAEEAAKIRLSDQLRAEVRDAAPLNEPSLFSDLLGAALDEVNWHEIAGQWLSELEPPAEPCDSTPYSDWQPKTDPAEDARIERFVDINLRPGTRAHLIEQYGRVWDTQEMTAEFEVISVDEPFARVSNWAGSRSTSAPKRSPGERCLPRAT